MRTRLFLGAALAWTLTAAGCLSIPSGVFDCTTEADCPDGFACDASGFCVQSGGGSSCSLQSDCPADELCDGSVCIAPPSCTRDPDCPVGSVCGRGGVCTTTCASPTPDPQCDTVACYNGVERVRINQLCDGVFNCPNDGGTALGYPFDEATCFTCPNGDPVHYYTHCDGIEDCPGGYDEVACFTCGSGEVIKQAWLCDDSDPGNCDCDDCSDETMCGQFMCSAATFIDWALVCDDNIDCPVTGDDEAGPCFPFDCADGSDTGLPQSWRCDGWGDCDDGSDENPMNCMVVCANGQRIDPALRCNGSPDCPDGSNADEMGCPP